MEQINKEDFIIGIPEKYDVRLLSNRVTIEGNLISLLLQDLTCYDDIHIDYKDFVSRDGRFLFLLGKELRSSGYIMIDEVTVYTHCSQEIKERINSMGGFKPIQHLMNVVNPKNYDAILDNFLKSNILMKLYLNGFNVFKEIELDNGKKIVPFDLFENFTYNQVIDWYDSKINTFGIANNNKIIGEEYIDFDDNFFESLERQEAMGTPYDNCGIDIYGNKISTFPFLSSTTMGFGTGLHALVGHSGVGKTVFSIQVLMSLIANGRRFIIVENEMQIKDLKIIILTFILSRYFKYTGLTKKRIINGIFSEEDKKMLGKAVKFWRDNFNKSLKIVAISDSDADLTCRIIKKSILREGFDGFLVDTFKMDNSGEDGNSNFWINLINDSKKLHEISLKYDVCGLVTIQLALSTLNRLWLDKSCLSTAKGVCEILDSCLGIRSVEPDELINGSPIFCRPFRSQMNSLGEWEEVPYENADPNNVWRMLFVIKNRKGVCSDDNGVTWLIRYSGDYCSMYETSKARSSRRLRNVNSNNY